MESSQPTSRISPTTGPALCSLCARKNLPCEGVGQQRFRFKHQPASLSVVNRQHAAAPARVASPPSNAASKLADSIVGLFEARHPGYNLGAIVRKSTVQHIGHSPVLDASLAALVGIVESLAPVGSSSSLSRLQLCRSSTGPLHKYTSALGALRESLDNPVIRYQRDTLLAVFVLSSCHMWLVDGADESRGHMDGLAHLITAVLNKDVQLQDQAQFSDDALKLSAIQLVFDATAEPRHLAPRPWHKCETKKPLWPYDFYCLDISVYLIIPQLLRRPRENMQSIELIYNMIRRAYPRCVKDVNPMHELAVEDKLEHDAFMQAIQVEAQSLHIAIGLNFNAFLRASGRDFDDRQLAEDRAAFCADAATLAEKSKSQLPLSAHHIPLSTIAAWCTAEQGSDLKIRLRRLLEDYRASYAMIHVLHSAPYWREAPEKLSREIPWFPKYIGSPRERTIVTEDKSDEFDAEMYEYCCIL
ncbi:hypothetical protein MAA_05479 [Metarhizium robertsii ARSEF 23]|uniref:Uncharacterized protein n=1 Tax=Metarhizium robertsii (strain ARSEF 23 / ATCC MYA-3075) TaxID=655844 RepID=E9EZN0_METRA|nr:uncharacterized protein MAA_05479 [Metarhizium robertsii ARSEF 23]EFY99421.2 hypothetical protein MAA_05479 [Metarhizium robertsii ARSEF 23]